MELMEGLSRWLCSFYADKVNVQQRTATVTCGDYVLLCTIHLADPKSQFKDYHENKITVLYNNKEVRVDDFKVEIGEVNPRQIDVFCMPRRAGKATVRLDLGKWYLFEGK